MHFECVCPVDKIATSYEEKYSHKWARCPACRTRLIVIPGTTGISEEQLQVAVEGRERAELRTNLVIGAIGLLVMGVGGWVIGTGAHLMAGCLLVLGLAGLGSAVFRHDGIKARYRRMRDEFEKGTDFITPAEWLAWYGS